MDARIKSGHDGCVLWGEVKGDITSIVKTASNVIPGWSQRVGALRRPMTGSGPDLRCAIAHRGISRFRVRCGACHRAALRADPLASPRNDGVWVASSPQRLQTQVHIRLRVPAARCARVVHLSSAQERAWGMPDARCTRGLVCNCSDRTHTSNNEDTGIDAEPVIGPRFARTRWHRPGMTVSAPIPNMTSRSRGAMRPRFAFISRPLEGVGNAGCPLHPRPRVQL
jgi:hypothetical protein